MVVKNTSNIFYAKKKSSKCPHRRKKIRMKLAKNVITFKDKNLTKQGLQRIQTASSKFQVLKSAG